MVKSKVNIDVVGIQFWIIIIIIFYSILKTITVKSLEILQESVLKYKVSQEKYRLASKTGCYFHLYWLTTVPLEGNRHLRRISPRPEHFYIYNLISLSFASTDITFSLQTSRLTMKWALLLPTSKHVTQQRWNEIIIQDNGDYQRSCEIK